MKYCKKCLMPDTRPGSIFDKDGICQACRNYEGRKSVDWEERKRKLKEICDKYRRRDGYYDCIIPVSGGKDSHFLVYTMKKEMNMNPLLVTVGDPFTKTEAGAGNLRNLLDTFNCDHIQFNLSIDLFGRVTRIAFEERGEPLRFIEAVIYTAPFKIAVKLGIPLIVYGENSAYEYGTTDKESLSAMGYIMSLFKSIDANFWLANRVTNKVKEKEINSIIPPSEEEVNKARPEPIFMSYFTEWSSLDHLEIARRHGFTDLSREWKREGCIEDFEQIDSVGYMVHLWLKYPKFGFQRTSDIASRRIREGLLTLPEGKRLIMENDHKLDGRAMKDFIDVLGYTPGRFWEIVEGFRNHKIFENVNGEWRLKDPVYKDLIKEQTHA